MFTNIEMLMYTDLGQGARTADVQFQDPKVLGVTCTESSAYQIWLCSMNVPIRHVSYHVTAFRCDVIARALDKAQKSSSHHVFCPTWLCHALLALC